MLIFFIATILLFGTTIGQEVTKEEEAPTNSTRALKTPRVLNGLITDIRIVPYQIHLRHWNPTLNFWEFRCGGGILSEWWVITAGHCVDDGTPLIWYYIYAGTSTLDEDSSTLSRHTVNNISIHPDYSRLPNGGLKSDIALIRVSPDIQFDVYRKPLRLPPYKYIPLDISQAVISGWGAYDDTYTVSNELRSAVVPIVSKSQCQRFSDFIWEGQICSGWRDYLYGFCHGDSGGPLVEVSTQFVIGIGSFGSPYCLAEGLPTVYTEVSFYRNWIRFQIGF